MSRRNYNTNNYFDNYQYQYEYYSNYPYGMYQEPYENDNYNYYTNGKFKKINNGNVPQYGHYSNQYYEGYGSYDMQYNWGYTNSAEHRNRYTIDRRNTNKNFNNCVKKSSTISHENNRSEEMERPTTRIISKQSLKENEMFATNVNGHFRTAPAPLNYTDYWLKSGKSDNVDMEIEEPENPCYVLETKQSKQNPYQNKHKGKNKKQMPEVQKVNEFEKKFGEMLTAPVEMSKGRSLLEKMGWRGGGLGKDGEGIVEPIAPQAFYAGTTIGLGVLTEEDEDIMFIDHVYLRTLKVILEFVKNDLEKELKFDPKLTPMERKRIHRTIQEMRDGVQKFPEPYKTVIMDIYYYNNYELYTESEGYRKERHLTLYKEPREHMYIVVPEDLNCEENLDRKVNSDKQKIIAKTQNMRLEDNNMPEASYNKNIIQSAEKGIDIIQSENGLKEKDSNEVENVVSIQDKGTVKSEDKISHLGSGAIEWTHNKDSNNITDVVITQNKNTVINVDSKSQSQNEEIENDNTFIEKNSYVIDSAGFSEKEDMVVNGENSRQSENEFNVMNENKVDSEEGNSNTIDVIKNEVLYKDGHENLQSMEECNQETVKNGQLSKSDQISEHIIINMESSKGINENNLVVTSGNKRLTKKQIRKLRAQEKIKANKKKPKHVIEIKIKENNKKEVNEILDLIVKYFIEYTQDPLVTEFRFLGPFDYKEISAINMFFKVCKGIQRIDKSQEVIDLFDSKDYYLEIRHDNNEKEVIYKFWKNQIEH